MSDDLRDLYQEVILDHGKRPRNFRQIDNASHHAHGHNPLCGDQLVVYLALDEAGVVQDVSFVGKGCAISTASASLMTEILKGKSEAQAKRLFELFHAMCTGEDSPSAEGLEDEMERLEVLSGVREFPSRVKCATLAWHTVTAAMAGQDQISTED
ncbi:MAG: SUF system NifU family Fe-S cluster assembly protein [Alphaproteobacteria bacterium]|nr:SUF system NifU family Fe-S cluster assembly protein [Alphaproteobacteria bacterium]MBU0798987.1 SUF system NifU family Fe-S cluster assembly protein [Alphaproteobacteria bacterium]MBU0887744.1 SUF system NifU family Fe-S cluster assembly protein [Alphaproteobacteria bacterium]MBU1815033.1 SUF system NifU family Fe-S cluster assembly protein [Alphaproteobacteria bacterium]